MDEIGCRIVIINWHIYYKIGVIMMKSVNEDKIRTSLYKKNSYVNYYTKLLEDISRYINPLNARKNNKVFQYTKKNNAEKQRRNRIIISYRICQNKKYSVIKNNNYYSEDIIELMDQFRNILNLMLEEENGLYMKNEILEVSRELDDMIYYYYKYENKEVGM